MNKNRELYLQASIVRHTISDMEVEISRARSILNGAFTLVESRLLEASFGEYTRFIEDCAGDINVLISVARKMLEEAEKIAADFEGNVGVALAAEESASATDKESKSI